MGYFRKILVMLAVCLLILPSAACKHGDSQDDGGKQSKKTKVKEKKADEKNKKDEKKNGEGGDILDQAEEKYQEIKDKIETDEKYREIKDKIESDERYQEIKKRIEKEVDKYKDKDTPEDDE
jgi:hypothetical protein